MTSVQTVGSTQEVLHDAGAELGLCEMRSVPGPRDQGECGVWKQARHPHTPYAEADVVGAGQHQHRAADLAKALPQRLLGARAGEPQARREPSSRVAATLGDPCIRETREHRGTHPPLQEVLEVAFDLACQLVVTTPAFLSCGAILDPRGGADEHEASEGRRSARRCRPARRQAQSGVERDPGAERVPDEVEPIAPVASRLGEHLSSLEEPGAHVTRASMAGKIDGNELAPGRDERGEPPPRAGRLGKPVGEDQARTGSRGLGMQHAP